jgi:hypothetical protein
MWDEIAYAAATLLLLDLIFVIWLVQRGRAGQRSRLILDRGSVVRRTRRLA